MSYSSRLPLLLIVSALSVPVLATPPVSPTDTQVSQELEACARANRVPSVLLKGLAWRQSHWRQWDTTGKVVESAPGRVGLLGVAVGKRPDADRLRTDWRYNIQQGTKALVLAWDRAPIIGNGRLDDGRNILECWYFALGRYGAGAQGDAANAYANSVLDAVASGAGLRWPSVTVTRPSKAKLSWGQNVIGAPVPWHFGDVAPRPPAQVSVALKVPHLHQTYDSPDDFNGGGSCGPTSMLMVLAFFKKVEPQPTLVSDSHMHQTAYGALIPGLDARVCEPNVGAVHAKMVDYFRPFLPEVAIFYNEKATWARVKAELDAGRPVMLGTRVTGAGHIMVAKGYLSDGRLLVNDPAGDREQAARKGGPSGGWSPTGGRYWNGDGERAVYEWDSLEVRWIMTFGAAAKAVLDPPEDK
jgi:hypothetical protein